MSSNSEKKEKSLAEFVIVIVLVAIMMTIFIRYFMTQEQQITVTGFNALAQSFNSKVTVVHAQWLMDKQPLKMVVSSFNRQKPQIIPVNKKGWIDVKHNNLACEKIWQHTLEVPMQILQTVVSAIEIQKSSMKKGRLCRFSIISGQYFEYQTNTGRIKLGNSRE
ncbi:MAG: hypothetical protein OCD00_04300 [Colwellia sp.]